MATTYNNRKRSYVEMAALKGNREITFAREATIHVAKVRPTPIARNPTFHEGPRKGTLLNMNVFEAQDSPSSINLVKKIETPLVVQKHILSPKRPVTNMATSMGPIPEIVVDLVEEPRWKKRLEMMSSQTTNQPTKVPDIEIRPKTMDTIRKKQRQLNTNNEERKPPSTPKKSVNVDCPTVVASKVIKKVKYTSDIHASTEEVRSKRIEMLKNRGFVVRSRSDPGPLTRETVSVPASEEGRKRSTVYLPPMEREPTFNTVPSKRFSSTQFSRENGHIYQGSMEDLQPNHWNLRQKKVSEGTQHKIVTHLRKKLTKRLEKRISNIIDKELKTNDGDQKDNASAPVVEESTRPPDIYHTYNDWGEKVIKKHKNSIAAMVNSFKKQGDTLGELPNDNHKSVGVNNKMQISNPVGQFGANQIEETDLILPAITKDIHGMTLSDHFPNIHSDRRLTKRVSLQEMPHIINKDESTIDENDNIRRKVAMSPVQTPLVNRPESRQSRIFSVEERMTRILQGEVHLECPHTDKVITIYISSAFTDSEMERTDLMYKVYPQIKQLCKEKGYVVQMLDLHWGFKDFIFDDHFGEETCLKALTECQEHSNGLNFVSFLGQKYGSFILPKTINGDEFEAILRAVRWDKDKDSVSSVLEAYERKILVTENQRKKNKGSQASDEESSPRKTPLEHFKQSAKMIILEQRFVRAIEQFSTPVENEENGDKQETAAEPGLLTNWYKKDTNVVPYVYRLQKISTMFKSINSRDASKKQQARNSWMSVQKKLSGLFEKYAEEALKDEILAEKYQKSLQEHELEQGILSLDETEIQSNCIWFRRNIDDMKGKYVDPKAREYVDLLPMRPVIDPVLKEKLSSLDKRMTDQMSPSCIINNTCQWSKEGISPLTNRNHFVYLEKVNTEFTQIINRHMLNITTPMPDESQDKLNLFEEVQQHIGYCHQRSREFHGRKEQLSTIKTYLRSNTKAPLIIYGPSGMGKSALIAKAAKDTHKWIKGTNSVIVLRMIGSTADSKTIRLFLRSLCHQLCEIYGGVADEIPEDIKGLNNDFLERLSHATTERPLVLYIDALDELIEWNDSRKLHWLPRELPENVHMILSTRPDERFQVYPALQSLYSEHKNNFIELPDFRMDDGLIVMHHLLDKHSHVLTQEQTDRIVESFRKCHSPLFLKVAIYEAIYWRSDDVITDGMVPGDSRRMINVFIGRLERTHGEPLVRRAMGYIAASRHGVTYTEIEDLLSLDDVVMEDIIGANNKLPVRRIPPLCLHRLYLDLKPFLSERMADGLITIRFSHAQFYEATEERYLKNKDKAPSYHKAMAEYFLGKWHGVKKAHLGNDVGSDRFVAPQPLFFERPNKQNEIIRVYNKRKLNELPHHLLLSNQIDILKYSALCNFEFLLATICSSSLRSLLDEFQVAIETEPKDNDLKLLSDTLQLSTEALSKDPRQLASQIVGRLHTIITHDVPASPGDPRKYPHLHPLFEQCSRGSVPALIPSTTCLTPPGGMLFDLLAGHSDPITAVTTTNDGYKAVTASKDGSLKMWDLRNGIVTRTIPSAGTNIVQIILGMNNCYACTVSTGLINIWSLRTGELVKSIDEYVDTATLALANEGNILVALFDGSNTLRSWDLESNFTLLVESRLESKGALHKDRSILASLYHYGNNVLVAYRSANYAMLMNSRSGRQSRTLQCNEEGGSVTALGMSRDYYIVTVRYQYMKLHELHNLELFDTKNGKYLRSVRGCTNCQADHLYVNEIGSHAISMCPSERNNTTDIAVWNLETEEHKHLAHQSKVVDISASLNFKFVLTANKKDNTLRIWNLSSKINQPGGSKKAKKLGVAEIQPMVNNPRYVIARAMNNGPISVWNVAKGKLSGSAVRIEHGLVDPSDIVVIRNTKVIILSERSFAQVGDESRPVLQTVYVYNLRTKRYEGKMTGLFIVPSPAHEYVLLDEDRLMGLSENRSHHIIWSLSSGHVLMRIKTNFKELERNQNHIPEDDVSPRVKGLGNNSKMLPWERRTETELDRKKRQEEEEYELRKKRDELKKETDNSIEQYIISEDLTVLVAAYYAHHLCVFDVEAATHTHTLRNDSCMMFLHVSALTSNGSHLVHANYDDDTKTSYLTLWDLKEGFVRKRLKNERDVMAVAIAEKAERIVFGKANNELRIWDPRRTSSLRKIKGYKGLNFGVDSKIVIIKEGTQAAVYAGDVSLWDLEKATVLAIFSPDTRIQCFNIAMEGNLLVFGMRDSNSVIILKLMSKDMAAESKAAGSDIFGEIESSSSEEQEDED
ncbi:unnamed protein product [Owenia fusiformis]|uniref:Uncharacterized protein n=1 Tax=Owenia fusiformis TaxID=6347 RepID=A0A8J1XWN8_OWEFU|nr:unnamed protein product [Owenia fusiformis]